jgi:hypothetical protein
VTCPHDSDDPRYCPPCQTLGRAEPPSRSSSGPFVARYAGDCLGCDVGIAVGERIRTLSEDGWAVGYVHDDPECTQDASGPVGREE